MKSETKTFVDGKGNTWEWEETPELVAALKIYRNTVLQNKVNGRV